MRKFRKALVAGGSAAVIAFFGTLGSLLGDGTLPIGEILIALGAACAAFAVAAGAVYRVPNDAA